MGPGKRVENNGEYLTFIQKSEEQQLYSRLGRTIFRKKSIAGLKLQCAGEYWGILLKCKLEFSRGWGGAQKVYISNEFPGGAMLLEWQGFIWY